MELKNSVNSIRSTAGYGKFSTFLWSYLICVFTLWNLIPIGVGFNIDVQNVITHRGPSESMFGFSVAQHRDSNVSWLLVGAPEADSRQPGVKKAGAVFRCSCEVNDNCQLIPFDRTGNNMVTNQQIDEKSGQWFGATVRSSGDDGIILACAPRYTWFTSNRKRKDPVGTCFVAKDSFTEFIEYSPCRTSKWGYHRQGSCQVGLGADVDPAGRRIFLGAVGSWYWQGQVYMIDSKKAAPAAAGQGSSAARSPFYQFLPPGQLYSSSSSLRPDIRSTLEGPSWDDDSYLGYSVISGEFNGDNDMDVAVGMPRGANLTGKVVVYSSDLVNIHNITGEQIGAYFGYALCVLDLDGDGLDDIVIGAPMYTDFQDSAMKIETGRVYVVYQNRKHKFKRWYSLDGTAHRGRFGTSLTALGDINRDTYPDFAVGAPYDGIGRGAVYIYQGSKEGVRPEYSQVIYGSSLQHPVSTFGFSLSGGKDLDGNGYPDLVVGAYESNVVTYFRSRPVVQVHSKLTFTSGKLINLEEKRCTLRDGTRVACMPLSLCMSYDGFGTDDLIDFNVQYILDSKKGKEPRMFFLNNEGAATVNTTLSLRKATEQCTNTQVYIRPQIRDKLTSLEAELRYSMVEGGRRVPRHLPPVIDSSTSITEKDSVSIRKNCGSDNICVPDLRLSVTQSDKSFVMGSSERVWIGVEVSNNGEDSFESMLYVQVPAGLSYVTVERLDTRKDISILCSPPTTNATMKCDIGNPLPAFATAKFKLIFQPKYGSEVKSAYEFQFTVNSTNPENEHRTSDNIRSAIMPIRVLTRIDVYGSSKPTPVPHNINYYAGLQQVNESTLGPEVTHVYEVKCAGPSNIEEASVVILWPSYTLDGSHLLYLLEQPIIEGPAQCEAVNVNPLGVKLQRNTKYVSHSSRSEIEDGEGRRSNFTYTSDYSSEGGGVYKQTYRNSSYETRRTGGGSYNKVGTSGSINNLDENFRYKDDRAGRIPDTIETSYRGSGVYGRTSNSGQIPDTQETSYRGGGSYSSGTTGGNGRISETQETSYRGSGNGRISETQETSYRGAGSYGSSGGNGRIPDTQETSYRASINYGSSSGSGNGRIPYVEETSYRAGTSYGGRSQSGAGIQDSEELSYRGGSSSDHSTISHGSQGGSYRGSGSTRPESGYRYRETGTIRGESRGSGGGSLSGGGGRTYQHTETSYHSGGGLSGAGFIPRGGGDYSLEETHLGALNHGHGGQEYLYERSGDRTFTSSTHNGRVSFDNRPVENSLSRTRRAADIDQAYEAELSECGDSKCTRIYCKIGQLAPNSSVIFYLRARVFSDTLQKKYAGQSLDISSKLLARVTELPYNVNPDFLAFKKLEVVTTVEEIADLGVSAPTPWYIYLIGIILGILLLLLLIFLLYKCGFFKRRRPNPTPEGQPLHRNGRQDRL